MSDRPAATDLLHTARAALLDDVLPQVPPSLHYTVRMIARAMAIAEGELRAPALPPGLVAELGVLAHDDGADPDRLGAALSARIRVGAFARDAALRARL